MYEITDEHPLLTLMNTVLRVTRPLFMLGIVLVLFCAGTPGMAAESCTSLLTGRCETCHYLTRVCDKVAEKKGKWSWKRTVKNMVRQGAKLNGAEQDLLVTCLSEPAAEVVKLCGQK